MIDTSVPKVQRPSTREMRGIALFERHQDRIRFDADARVWLVPSQRQATSVYEVTIGRRGDVCECADFEHRGVSCVHIHAATIARAKSGTCAGCGERTWRRDLSEVQESLAHFEGDLLCSACRRGSDADVL